MLKKITFIIIIELLLAINSLVAQDYYFKHFQVEDGLSNNTVYCSIQDKKGFLWFGTKDGLNRFDGYTFKNFHSGSDAGSGLNFNNIYTLLEDENNIIWVGTDKGLYKFDEKQERLFLADEVLTGDIRSLHIDKKGNIWFVSNLQLFRFTEKTRVCKSFGKKYIVDVSSVCETPDGTIWVSSNNGFIYRYNTFQDTFTGYNVFKKSKPSSSKKIIKLFATDEGSLLIGTASQGAKYFDIATAFYKDIITHYANNTEVLAHDFVRQSDDTYWIATDFGIFIYNLKTEKILNIRKDYNDPYSISDDAVHTLCKDREGGIWAGTYFGGVNYYSKQYALFKKYFPKPGQNSISGNVVKEIVKDISNNLWIGTMDAGLNKLNPGRDTFTHYYPTGNKSNVSFSTIFGLLATDDKLFIGTFQHGLDIFNLVSGKVQKHYEASKKPNSLHNNLIQVIYKTRSGYILIGTLFGLYKYDDKNKNFTLLPYAPENAYIQSITEDARGTIWVGTSGKGVYYYNLQANIKGNFIHDANNPYSLGSNIVNSIFEDSKKRLWFATDGGGLCKLNTDQKTFKRFTNKSGLPGNCIFRILEDNMNTFWISTSKGLVNLNPDSEKIIVYTQADGLLSNQFCPGSGYKDSTGRLYFGSVKGLISFNPAEIKKSLFKPPVYITGFQVNNREVDINEKNSPIKTSLSFLSKININYNQSSFSIDFAALSYTAPELTEYAYKMNGLDNEWTYLQTKRKAYFTKLPPGTYTLKIKAFANGDIKNATETKMEIVITPPFWQSWWAYFLYLLLITFIVANIIFNFRRKSKEKTTRKFEQLKHEHEKEIYEAKLDFFTNIAHEIRTPLTLIKGPLEMIIEKANHLPEIKHYLKTMDRNTNRLVDLTNQLLDFRKVETKGFSLHFEQENVSELLEDVYLRFTLIAKQKNLQYKLDDHEENLLAHIDVEAMNKILFNLFNNAITYAENTVEISIIKSNDNKEFSIIIKNDGHLIPYDMKDRIFDSFFRLKETERQQGTGIGLTLSKTLTDLHNGRLALLRPVNNMNIFMLVLPIHQYHELSV